MTSPIKSKTTVDIVCSYLRKCILDGTYKPQALLPPERKLAESLGVNRLTLRTAFLDSKQTSTRITSWTRGCR